MPDKAKTHPRLVVPQESPTPEETNGEVVEGTQYRDAAPSLFAEAVRTELERERRKPQSAPSPVPASIIDLIPKQWRPYVAILLLIMGSGSVSWLANLRTIWELPAEVTAIKEEQVKQRDQLNRIEALLQEPASRPRR